MNTLIEMIIVTREKVSKKSIFSLCLKPLTTCMALYLFIVPSCMHFFPRIHLHPITLEQEGKSINSLLGFMS